MSLRRRKNMNRPIYFMCFLIQVTQIAIAERLHEQIYLSIEGAACFRRLNGTHQAGCSSSDSGTVGVVHMIRVVEDAEWMTQNGTAGPYVAVVSTSLFHNVIERLMSYPGAVAGALVYENDTERATSFSQESRCPNEYYSADGSQCSSASAGGIVWNEEGTGLIRRDISFPIFYIPATQISDIESIENCYNRYNADKDNQKGSALCSLQLQSFMYAAVSAEVCMRRSRMSSTLSSTKFCDPLGDHNILYSLFPRKEGDDKTVTLVTARIDTASLFDGLSPGAASSVVGMVSLITSAVLLSKIIPIADADLYNHNILWTLLNGEAFDYIGSQRVAYDLSRGAWPPNAPLKLSQIKLHLELGQLGGSFGPSAANVTWPLNAFVPYLNGLPSEVTEFLAEISSNLNKNNLTIQPEITSNLPPSSLHSFRRILANVTLNGELPEVLLADHGNTFTNKFYHSVLDDSDGVQFFYKNISIGANGTFVDTDALIANGTMKETDMQVKIAKLASSISHTLYQQVVGAPYTGAMKASAHLVDEMLFCFLRSQACRLLTAADYAQTSGISEEAPQKPAPLYVSVLGWQSSGTIFAGHLFALLAGQHLNHSRSECSQLKQPGFSHYYLRGWNNSGVCIQTTLNFTQALSPAFVIPDYDYRSGLYSTWTESVWREIWLRMFVSAGGAGAKIAAITGAIATIIVASATYWLDKHARTIFVQAPPIVPIATVDATTGILRSVHC